MAGASLLSFGGGGRLWWPAGCWSWGPGEGEFLRQWVRGGSPVGGRDRWAVAPFFGEEGLGFGCEGVDVGGVGEGGLEDALSLVGLSVVPYLLVGCFVLAFPVLGFRGDGGGAGGGPGGGRNGGGWVGPYPSGGGVVLVGIPQQCHVFLGDWGRDWLAAQRRTWRA